MFFCFHVSVTFKFDAFFCQERFSGAIHGREFRGEFGFATFIHDISAAAHATNQSPCRSFSVSTLAISSRIMLSCHRAFHLGSVSLLYGGFLLAGSNPIYTSSLCSFRGRFRCSVFC